MHFAATLNAIIFDGAFSGRNTDELAGWAGDLQSMIRNLHDGAYPGYRTTPLNESYALYSQVGKKVIGVSNSMFSRSDMLADIDAFNISKMLESNYTDLSLSSVLESYYNCGASQRFTTFVVNYGGFSELQERVEYQMSDKFGFPPLIIQRYQRYSTTSVAYKALNTVFMDYIKNAVEKEK